MDVARLFIRSRLTEAVELIPFLHIVLRFLPKTDLLTERTQPITMANQQVTDVYIAVVGVAGAGKNSLISACAGQTPETSVEAFPDTSFIYNENTRVHLIDIPGFTDADPDHDTTPEQERTLERINKLIADGKTISGIIFLHPITTEANTTLALRNIELFRSLCGPTAQAQSFAVLATSMWSQVDNPEDAARRESALVDDASASFFGRMHQDGSKVFRFSETKESALDMVSYLLAQRNVGGEALPTPPMTPQLKVAKPHYPVPHKAVSHKAVQTDVIPADDPFHQSILRAREAHMARLADMYAHMEAAARDHDTAMQGLFGAEVEALRRKIATAEEGQARLRQVIVETNQQKNNEISALRSEMAAARAAFNTDLEARDKTSREQTARLEAEHARALEEKEKAVRAEGDRRIQTLVDEMSAESDERVHKVRIEMEHEMVERVGAVRAEMDRLKVEHDQNMMALKTEIRNLMAREEKALERARTAELARKGDDAFVRQPLQAWAVARLWGVGQARTSNGFF
ncbi:hypothetical protein QBC47DRAFT_379865 [Echria macrotheca]|uniref:G domain-containing protein n=1 Tax=Echria macrotheca TaxID=438768 RepID=A0AAJ0BDQ6_9PEZI|nr:hypothetical protein QBC47DRAFT_379865 [Echria macrotheca]